MECIACGLKSGYNRVVIELRTGRELGGLCFRCEERQYGNSLKDGLWAEAEGCVMCSRDGLVALPEWRPTTSDSEGGLHLTNEYVLDDATVLLCDEHFTALRGGGEPTDRRQERPVNDARNAR